MRAWFPRLMVWTVIISLLGSHELALAKPVCLEYDPAKGLCTRWDELHGSDYGTTTPPYPTPPIPSPPPDDDDDHQNPDTLPASPASPVSPPPDDDDDHQNWIVPAVIGGAIALTFITKLLAQEKGPSETRQPDPQRPQQDALERAYAEHLMKHGPQLPTLLNMSAFAMRGLVKSGWPLVIEFEQDIPGSVDLRISAKGVDTFTYHLGDLKVGRRHVIIRLPPDFGDQLKPALIAVTATSKDNSQSTMRSFRLLQLGCGPGAIPGGELGQTLRQPLYIRAAHHNAFHDLAAGLFKVGGGGRGQVRSIDQMFFHPPNIQTKHHETAAFRFYSHSDFESISVEFVKVGLNPDGESNELVNDQVLPEGIRRDQWVGRAEPRNWDGRDRQRSVSQGQHKLRVRAWDDEGDWDTVWSDSRVTVFD